MKGVDVTSTDFPHANKPEVVIDEKKLKRLEGEYASDFVSFEIKEFKGKLLYVIGGNEVELLPHSETVFTTKTPYGIIFELDEYGKPLGCKLYHSFEGLVYCYYSEKTEPKKLPPVKEEWKKFVGLYYTMYYYTEYRFTSISLDEEGYLLLAKSRLLPLENESNIFQNRNGKIVVFNSNSFIYDNLEHTRLENAVQFFEDISEKDPQHRALVDYMIDTAIAGLKQLNQKEDAKRLEEIKKK
jgi:hypothetical protein